MTGLRLTNRGAALLLLLTLVALLIAAVIGQHLQRERCAQPGACHTVAGVAWRVVTP